MNEPPDDRALAAYLARARHHSTTIDLADEILTNPKDRSARDELMIHALREQSRRGLRIMHALAAAWNRDKADRQARNDQWECDIKNRYSRFRSG